MVVLLCGPPIIGLIRRSLAHLVAVSSPVRVGWVLALTRGLPSLTERERERCCTVQPTLSNLTAVRKWRAKNKHDDL